MTEMVARQRVIKASWAGLKPNEAEGLHRKAWEKVWGYVGSKVIEKLATAPYTIHGEPIVIKIVPQIVGGDDLSSNDTLLLHFEIEGKVVPRY